MLLLEPYWLPLDTVRELTDAQIDAIYRSAERLYDHDAVQELPETPEAGDDKLAAKVRFLNTVRALGGDPREAEQHFERQWSASHES